MTDKSKVIVVKTTDDLAIEGLINVVFWLFAISMLLGLFFKFLDWLKDHPFVFLAIATILIIAVCYGAFLIFKKLYLAVRRLFN